MAAPKISELEFAMKSIKLNFRIEEVRSSHLVALLAPVLIVKLFYHTDVFASRAGYVLAVWRARSLGWPCADCSVDQQGDGVGVVGLV